MIDNTWWKVLGLILFLLPLFQIILEITVFSKMEKVKEKPQDIITLLWEEDIFY